MLQPYSYVYACSLCVFNIITCEKVSVQCSCSVFVSYLVSVRVKAFPFPYLSQAPCTQRRRNLETHHISAETTRYPWYKRFFSRAADGNTSLPLIDTRNRSRKTSSTHAGRAQEKFENVPITGHFGYLFEENSVREVMITWLS